MYDPSLTALGGAGSGARLPLTLAQVRDRISDLSGLSAQKRADLRSALNTIGRALSLPLDAIPSAPPILRPRLERVSPAALGISPQSWANARSRALKALELSGIPVMAGRSVRFIAPEWRALQALIDDKYRRHALSRFFSFCSARGLSSEDVTPKTFEAYRISVEQQSIRARQQQSFRDTCRAWNAARKAIPGWTDVEVAVPDLRDHYALPWETFPASLKADIDAMVADATGADLVSMKARRRIAPQSARRRVENLHRLISGYVRRGGDPQGLLTLADVVRREIVCEGLRFMLERSGGKPTTGTDGAIVSILTVARQWVAVPDAELQELKRIRRSLDVQVHGMAPETRALLRRFDDEAVLASLLNAPGEVIRRCTGRNRLRQSEAVGAQVALAVHILLDAPLRVHNLVSVNLERHLVRLGSGRRARMHLHFTAEEVKNRRELELPLSPETVELLDFYMQFVRPQLVRTPHSFLFPGEGASHKGAPLLSEQIAKFVHKHVGIRVTAHKFRHLIGYLYLKQNPAGHEVVRQLLGHKSIATTIKFYASLEQDEAFRLYDSLLDGLRQKARVNGSARKRQG